MRLQSETDFNDPAQRFEWALEGLPMNGMPVAIPSPIKKEWSKRLSQAGFVHVSQLSQFADEEGRVNLSDLPYKQEIHFQPPIRGQHHTMNTAGEWVPVNQPIQPPVVPVASQMTASEKAKMINEFREEGLLD